MCTNFSTRYTYRKKEFIMSTIYQEYLPIYSTKDILERKKNPILRSIPMIPIEQKSCPQKVPASEWYHELERYATAPFRD